MERLPPLSRFSFDRAMEQAWQPFLSGGAQLVGLSCCPLGWHCGRRATNVITKEYQVTKEGERMAYVAEIHYTATVLLTLVGSRCSLTDSPTDTFALAYWMPTMEK